MRNRLKKWAKATEQLQEVVTSDLGHFEGDYKYHLRLSAKEALMLLAGTESIYLEVGDHPVVIRNTEHGWLLSSDL